jgi:predicted ATPase/DNA-binding winged helix-turn-helix (wHTH) protein
MAGTEASSSGEVISFGPFRLSPAERLLEKAGAPVNLRGFALDILITLVSRPGKLVTKKELFDQFWAGTTVGEATLRVHVSALRRALSDGQEGARYVTNIPGRGYCFVAPLLRTAASSGTTALDGIAGLPPHNLPARTGRIIGRDGVIQATAEQLLAQRLVTLVGAGGIGKTTVAIAVADLLLASFRNAVSFVDLAPLADPLLVPSALASVLGLIVQSENPLPTLARFLRNKRALIVLDNCDRMIEAAAQLVDRIFKQAPNVHILVTSREPLRVDGERVHRLRPLAVPPSSRGLTAKDALNFSAVELFVERVAASSEGFELSDANAADIADICRRLDGIALAIELAAGHVDAFGVGGLAARLADRFRLLALARRTALPRHQTLRATLDWSSELLPESERVILRRLAVFAGSFTAEAATAVVAGTDFAPSHVVELVPNLVAKSLVTADVGGAVAHYRLLETTRAYALDQLTKSGELEPTARRHAEYHRDVFERAEADWETTPTSEWLAVYLSQIDNMRSALDWAFSPSGDTEIGVALAVAAVPLWFQLSLMDECRSRVERALATFDPEASHRTRRDMKLFAALATAMVFTNRGAHSEIHAAWTSALEIAERFDDTDYQLRALWGLWLACSNNSEHRVALALAERFRSRAETSTEPADRPVGDRMIGVSLQLLGDQPNARRHIERALGRYVSPVRRSHISRFHFDQRVMARTTLAEILWLQGFPDQAMRTAETNVAESQSIDHSLSQCYALAQAACPVALWSSDVRTAERFVAMLTDQAARRALDRWHAWNSCINSFRGVLLIKQGDLVNGLQVLRTSLTEGPDTRFFRHLAFLGELAEALGHSGEIGQGLTVVNEALTRSERSEERWCIAELLRIKGGLVCRQDAPTAAGAAEGHFLQSLDWARRQKALSWELRTATSFARFLRDQGRNVEARFVLASVYNRFTEGFGTGDLVAAKTCLEELDSTG